jgi:hypothetical protein
MLRSSLRLDSGGQQVASWTATRRPSQSGFLIPSVIEKPSRLMQLPKQKGPPILWRTVQSFTTGDLPQILTISLRIASICPSMRYQGWV